MISAPDSAICRICGQSAQLLYRGHPGYVEPSRFDIFYCNNCDVSFAQPFVDAGAIYKLIYQNASRVPAYSRYFAYADQVLLEPKPLEYLAAQEHPYWGIMRILNLREQAGLPTKEVLELGCGLGYLTYALRRYGLQACGLDISDVAVQEAHKRYGQFYMCGDAAQYVGANPSRYDLIILSELLEHIPDPVGFLRAVVKGVAPGGTMVVTVPNRDVFPKSALWETCLPPVHWWWFTARTLRSIAQSLDCDITFVDFGDFNKENFFSVKAHWPSGKPTRKWVFDQSGSLVRDDADKPFLPSRLRSALRGTAARLGLLEAYRRTKAALNGERRILGEGFCLCASILPRPGV